MTKNTSWQLIFCYHVDSTPPPPPPHPHLQPVQIPQLYVSFILPTCSYPLYLQQGETVLLMACGAGQLEIVEYLHSKGANLNVLDKVRNTVYVHRAYRH